MFRLSCLAFKKKRPHPPPAFFAATGGNRDSKYSSSSSNNKNNRDAADEEGDLNDEQLDQLTDRAREIKRKKDRHEVGEVAADIFQRLCESLEALEDIDRRTAIAANSATQQLAFNEAVSTSLADALQTCVAVAVDNREMSGRGSAARRTLDRLALERGLSRLEFEFSKMKPRARLHVIEMELLLKQRRIESYLRKEMAKNLKLDLSSGNSKNNRESGSGSRNRSGDSNISRSEPFRPANRGGGGNDIWTQEAQAQFALSRVSSGPEDDVAALDNDDAGDDTIDL